MVISSTILGGGLGGCTPFLPEGRVAAFSELEDWDQQDFRDVLSLFRQFCAFKEKQNTQIRVSEIADKQDVYLKSICHSALALPSNPDAHEARVFFENHFTPYEVKGNAERNGKGFLTGYYEPEFSGSLIRSGDYQYPLYSPPPGYISVARDAKLSGIPEGRTAARVVRDSSGKDIYLSIPTRGEIEQGALQDLIQPIVYFKEPGHAFIIHVQGSARIRLPDNSTLRVAFAGRNGHPYSSIGKVLVQKGEIALKDMSLENLLGWLRDYPEKAQDIMNHNQSFIFFRIADELADAQGPVGAAGMPLVPELSLAVDHTLWSYGLPVWLEGTLPGQHKEQQKVANLHLALDTGAAITGPARADYFWGSGDRAGFRAGLTSQNMRFVVLLPKSLFINAVSSTQKTQTD